MLLLSNIKYLKLLISANEIVFGLVDSQLEHRLNMDCMWANKIIYNARDD